MKKKIPCMVFLTLELLLYGCLLYENFAASAPCGSLYSSLLRYSAVLLCFLFQGFLMLFLPEQLNDTAPGKLTALAVTAAADFFLIFSGAYPAGVALYCLVQLIYLRLNRSLHTLSLNTFLLPLFFPSLVILGGIYLILSICSLTLALKPLLSPKNTQFSREQKKQQKLFALGLLLLLLCDIQVGLSFLLSQASPASYGAALCSSLIWIFYLPSLVCIVLSSLDPGDRNSIV